MLRQSPPKLLPGHNYRNIIKQFVAGILLATLHFVNADNQQLGKLVKNGGFEEGEDIPKYWGRWTGDATGKNKNKAVRDTEIFHSGTASARLEWHGKEKLARHIQWNQFNIPVKGGSEIIISAYARSEGVKNPTIRCYFYEASAKKPISFRDIIFPIEIKKDMKRWFAVRKNIFVPENASFMGMILYIRPGGKVWFDDIEVIETPSLQAQRGTPVIDGIINDLCWKENNMAYRFYLHPLRDSLRSSKEKITAWIAYDDSALYVAFCCTYPQGKELLSSCMKNDDEVWHDDSIEVFLAPTRKKQKDYFQVIVNPSGIFYDSKNKDSRWFSSTVVKTTKTNSKWYAEIKIPYKSMGITLDTDEKWRMNFCRNDKINGETVLWSPEGIHNPDRFGDVVINANFWNFQKNDLINTISQFRSIITENKLEWQKLLPSLSGYVAEKSNAYMQEFDLLEQELSSVNEADRQYINELIQRRNRLNLMVRDMNNCLKNFKELLALKGKIVEIHRSYGRILTKKELAEVTSLFDRAKGIIAAVQKAVSDKKFCPKTIDKAKEKVDKLMMWARTKALQSVFTSSPQKDFCVSIASSLQKVRRNDRDPLNGELCRKVELSCARSETESFQLVVSLKNREKAKFSIEPSELKNSNGKKIPLECYRVGYVKTRKPKYSVEYVGYWPDILYPVSDFTLKQGMRQPVWFMVHIPKNAEPGIYEGAVIIKSCDGERASVPVKLKVRNFTLPFPGKLPVTIWIWDWNIDELYYGENNCGKNAKRYKWWTPEGRRLNTLGTKHIAQWCEFMMRHRINPNAGIAFPFVDKRPLMQLKLLAHPSLPSRSSYIYILPPGPSFRNPFYKVNMTKIKNGLTEAMNFISSNPPHMKPVIWGIDEADILKGCTYPIIPSLYEKVQKFYPNTPILQNFYFDANPEDLVGYVDIWCPRISVLDSPFYSERLKKGEELYLYLTANISPYASFMIDQPAISHRILFWQAWKKGCTGVLYWCSTWWRGLPIVGGIPASGKNIDMKFADNNGNGLLIWPGTNLVPYSSIRLEIIRDGIEDYEYLALLKQLLQKADGNPKLYKAGIIAKAKKLLDIPNNIVRTMDNFTKEEVKIYSYREKIGDIIEELRFIEMKK